MLIATFFVLLAAAISLFIQIDDWSRDLSVNHAETSKDAFDPSLRTLELPVNAENVKAAIEEFAERSSRWTFIKSTDNELSLVRTSRLFRFSDDVQVVLQSTDNGTQVDVTSRSRVGKGDLGQNPRNIRSLLEALRAKFR